MIEHEWQRINELVIRYLKMPKDDGNPINNPMGGSNRCYSTYISDAWLVVEKMMEDNYVIKLQAEESDGGDWSCWFGKRKSFGKAQENKVCMAICLAALRTKGIKI